MEERRSNSRKFVVSMVMGKEQQYEEQTDA